MKTLIVYATKYGSTEKCAKKLTEKLTGEVDLCNLAVLVTNDLQHYDKVIIGGSIYAGRIQKQVTEFCAKNSQILKEKQLGLFICGMMINQAETELCNAFAPELYSKAVVKDFFGGELKFQKINFLEKFMVKMVSKMDKTMPTIDTSSDFSMISEETIARFAQNMNNVVI